MTAVASAPNFQSLSRNGWPSGNGTLQTMSPVSSEDVSRMLIPRKSAQRSNSSSSLSSQASSSSTLSASSTQLNGNQNCDVSWGSRKKPARGPWPAAKAEPASSLSSVRPQAVPASTPVSAAASAVPPIHTPSSLLPSQHMIHAQSQHNGVMRSQSQLQTPAILHLLPMNGTFEQKTITIPFAPDVLRIGRQTNQRTQPTATNGYFDSKVLSRQHAEIWAERDGKIWIRDVKSSNGTFVNGKRLSQENRDSEPHSLKEQDVLELGIDIVSEDQKTVVHHKVAARVEHAGIYGFNSNVHDFTSGDLDPCAINTATGQLISQTSRARPSGQASNTSSNRFSQGASTAAHNHSAAAAYHAKWLQPVTMEQIVKKLHVELKQARFQSQDLQYTTGFVEALVANERPPPCQPQKASSPIKPGDSAKSRFSSSPPAPPPQQPLPEKPASALRARLQDLPALQPLLRRTDTERARPQSAAASSTNDSPIRSDQTYQILNLVEALANAQKEISSQSHRLREMEDALHQAREAKVRAEERVIKLGGSPSSAIEDSVKDGAPQQDVAEDDRTNTLPQRLEVMRAELVDMRIQVERYRRRAEEAEQEGEKDRQSLAEMVESIRRRDDALRRRQEQRKKKSSRVKDDSGRISTADIEATSDPDDDLDVEELSADSDVLPVGALERQRTARPLSHLNGTAVSPGALSVRQLHDFGRTISAVISQGSSGSDGERGRIQEQLIQSAPYASLLGVVLLGVGMMAYLNGWQKGVVER